MDEKVEKEFILNMHGHYSEAAIDHARNPAMWAYSTFDRFARVPVNAVILWVYA
jgi:hypothetical protein